MTPQTDIDDVKFPLKTVLTIVLFVGQFLYFQFTMSSKIEKATEDAANASRTAEAANDKISAANISLITYKVDQINVTVNEIKEEMKKKSLRNNN